MVPGRDVRSGPGSLSELSSKRASGQVVPLVPAGWGTVDQAAAALESVPLPPLLIVSTTRTRFCLRPAEAALEQLVAYLPSEAH